MSGLHHAWRIGLGAMALGVCAQSQAQLVELTWEGLIIETERLDLAPAALQGVTPGDLFRIEMVLNKTELEAGGVTGIYAGPFESVTVTIGAASATSDIVTLLTIDFFSDFLGGLRDEFSVHWDTLESGPYFTDGSALSESWSATAGLPLGTLSQEIPTDLDYAGDLLIPDTGPFNIAWGSTVSTTEGEVQTAINGLLFHVGAVVVPAPASGAPVLFGLAAAARRRR